MKELLPAERKSNLFTIYKEKCQDLKGGRPTRGSPGCVMRPPATFVNYVNTTKTHDKLGG
jgi:hypothetical protein